MISSARIGIAVFTVLTFAAPLAAGPVGQYFLTAGDQSTNWVVQDASVVTSWAQRTREYPIAVEATVRAVGPNAGNAGTEYTLAGVQTGTTFASSIGPGSMWDASTDGTNIYGMNFGTGEVLQFDLDWTNPTVLFDLGPASAFLGITYDPTNDSLWVSGWSSTTVANYSMAGVLLSSFSAPISSITCLALDPSDGTLWFGSQSTQGTFYQYSKAGVQLSTESYATLTSQNTLGGEFQFGSAVAPQNIPMLDPIGVTILALLIAGAGAAIILRFRLT